MASTGRTASGQNDLVKLDDELVILIKDITDSYDREDRQEREARRPLWMKLENYFNSLQRIYWDSTAKDYKSVDDGADRHYDKVINIYRAHAESIISALSIKPPSAIFYPDDADVEEDITTAKICVKIKENIERHNTASLLLIKSLLILFNQGMVASYIYNKKHSSFGTYNIPEYSKDPTKLTTVLLNCQECGNNIDEVVFKSDPEKVPEESRECGICGYKGIPVQETIEEEVPEIIGSTPQSKSRTIIEVFSPLFVYAPFYARSQEHAPYIRLKFEQHYSAVKNLYPKLKKKGFSKGADQNADERGIGVNVNDSNLVTVECWWVRDWGFDIIDGKDEEIKKLKKHFPDGFYAIYVDEQLVEVNNESLDDHWELSRNPLSTYIHAEPMGKSLAPIQDLANEVVDLQIETLEHSIPETFARSDVLDFAKYAKSEARPGMVYPALPPPDGQSLQSSFHTLKTASLTEETDLFLRRLDEKGQFVSAAFPSIYGGPSTSGSKTAREYSESRGVALQRLSLAWNIQKTFWAGTMSKAVPLYIHALRNSGEDEKIVEKTSTGFINSWIKQTDISGKIGRIEADANEDLPQSAAQLKDIIMQLLTLKDDFISQAMYHPQNIPLIAKALGAPDFYIPNSDDRNKQFMEFTELLAGVAVEVNQTIDDHAVEAEVCRTFIVSATGLMLRKSNPEGMARIEEHFNQHMAAINKTNPAVKGQTEPAVENPLANPASPETVKSEGEDNVRQFPVR